MTNEPSQTYQFGSADAVIAPFPRGARGTDQRSDARHHQLDEMVLQRAVLSWAMALTELIKSRST